MGERAYGKGLGDDTLSTPLDAVETATYGAGARRGDAPWWLSRVYEEDEDDGEEI